MPYLDDLNEMQRKAVEYCDGPSLVIASAGSGKTRVLTYKIAHLLQLGYKPWSIMALTFTNKAASVMKERIDKLIGEGSSKNIWMGTFHSVFLRILRYECPSIGFDNNFTIYDQGSSETLVKTIIKEEGLDDKVYNYKSIAAKISNLKSRLVTPLQYQGNAEYMRQDSIAKIPHFSKIYTRYFDRCRLANAMDFDDILLYTFLLFKENPEIQAKYAERFQFVLVDEYQDTNYAQHVIVNQLTYVHRKLCVVGDDAQSIYSFRGASINNILKFNQVYPEYKLFKLEQNYRSTQTIVKAANSVISKNEHRIDKVAFSDNETGDKINLYEATSDIEEGYYVINRIAFLHENEHLDFSSFAILYRTNSQSRVFEEALRKKAYPYIVYGGLSFYQRKEIKDIISYFRLVANHNDEDAFRRVINYPKRGIGSTSVTKIMECAVSSNSSVWDVVSDLEHYDTKISKGTLIRISEFKDMIEHFSNLLNDNNIYEIAKVILQESGIMRELYADMTIEGKARQENMEELVSAISTFVQTRIEEGNPNISLLDYLSEVSLLSDIDETEDKDNCVKLMTVHSAKGLEFNTVFVVGMEENLFPSIRNNTQREIEEERRLFYVAITRAEKRCFISYATSRYRYGKQEFSTVSRFVDELDKNYLRAYVPKQNISKSRRDNDGLPELSWLKRYKERQITQQPDKTIVSPRRPSPFQKRLEQPVTTASHTNEVQHNAIYGLSVGDYILHDRFGKGLIEKLEGDDIQCKALVDFDELGKKQLLLKFARFKKLI